MDNEINIQTFASSYAKNINDLKDQVDNHLFDEHEIEGSGGVQCAVFEMLSKLDLLFVNVSDLYQNSTKMIEKIIEYFGSVDKNLSENIRNYK